MKKFLLLSLLYFQGTFADQPLEEYFSFLKQLGQPNGNYRDGEIEVVVEPSEISKVQKVQEDRLLQKGFSAEDAKKFSRIGVVGEDQYWVWLRDAVYFPKGVPGTYDRLIWKSALKSGYPGIAVLPILPSGQIVLNLNYRHATRSWELELPRGAIQPEETIKQAALREVKEETGMIPSTLTLLGEVAPDSGVLSSVVPVFIGKITRREKSNPDYSEAIADVISFTKEELKEGLLKGFMEVSIGGKKRQVPLRDSFLTFALFQAELRHLL
ncbi:MAG: NUDIX hydrolase [Verrucomicrobia bacterium]|nr:NUDIX hydrolase [Verrucomicrobiota bacterium]